MAAIKPHLAEDGQTTRTQAEYWNCAAEGEEEGLAAARQGLCPTPKEVIEQTHAGLLQVAWTRQPLVEQMMQGMVIDVIQDGNKYKLRGTFPEGEEGQLVEGAAWNPYAATDISILSWTTKMGAPSFSLPAGGTPVGGSCLGSIAGQSTSTEGQREQQAKTLLPILYGPRYKNQKIDLAKCICETCYAEGGQYGTSSVQYAQLLRFAWAQGALKQQAPSGRSVFVEVMIDAIDNADYKLGQEPKQWKRKGKIMRFFRLHDSGDFFSKQYFDAWKEITDWFHPTYGGPNGKGHPNPIWFWAPTRMWISPTWVKHISTVNRPRRGHEQNFSVRPSAYHVNEHGPLGASGKGKLGTGWAAATVVFGSKEKMAAEGKRRGKAFDWDCRAYAVEDGPTCRGAQSNPAGGGKGKPGCRNCWMLQKERTNYTWHD